MGAGGFCFAAMMKLRTAAMTAVVLTMTQAVQPAAMKAMPVMSHLRGTGMLGLLKTQIVIPRATRAPMGGTTTAIQRRTLLRGPTVTGSGGTGNPFSKAST